MHVEASCERSMLVLRTPKAIHLCHLHLVSFFSSYSLIRLSLFVSLLCHIDWPFSSLLVTGTGDTLKLRSLKCVCVLTSDGCFKLLKLPYQFQKKTFKHSKFQLLTLVFCAKIYRTRFLIMKRFKRSHKLLVLVSSDISNKAPTSHSCYLL
jgi:hypothetical protein